VLRASAAAGMSVVGAATDGSFFTVSRFVMYRLSALFLSVYSVVPFFFSVSYFPGLFWFICMYVTCSCNLSHLYMVRLRIYFLVGRLYMYNKLIVKYGCNLVSRRNEDYSDPSNPSVIDRERRGRGNITIIQYHHRTKTSSS